jgi:hypothetical protein
MAADLTVTIGADLSELERGIAGAGQTISRGANRISPGGMPGSSSGGRGAAAAAGGAGGAGGMKFPGAGGTFTAIGALFGPVGLVIGQIVDNLMVVFEKLKELRDRSKDQGDDDES